MMTNQLGSLDEPAAGVNRTAAQARGKILSHRAHLGTFILIEHDMEMIEKLCAPEVQWPRASRC